MKKLLTALCVCALALVCVLALPTRANADTEGDYTYTVSGGNATITGYIGSGGMITIPSTLGGYPVTNIGDSAFAGCTKLTGITIPDSVTTVGEYAFSDCSSMTSATIGKNVTRIGYAAFSGCGSLEEMTIPIVGGSQDTSDIYGQTNSKIALFGYIFGSEAYEGGREVKQGFTKYTASGKLTTTQYSYTYKYSDHYGGGTIKAYYDLYETLSYSSMPYNYTNYVLNQVAKEQELRALHYVIRKTNEKRDGDSQLKELSAQILWTYGEPLEEYRQTYYIPETLKKVTVTNADRIYFGAFSYCNFIEEIYITRADTQMHTSVFVGTANTQVFCLKESTLENYILNGKHITGGIRYGGKYVAPAKPVIINVTDVSVTLQKSSGFEYSIDGNTWTESNVFTGLNPDTEYTFYQRCKSQEKKCLLETNYTNIIVYSAAILESDPSEVTVTTKPSLSGITISSLPTKLTYLEAKDDLAVRGGKLRLEYGNEHFEIIEFTADMVEGFNNKQVGPQTLTVTYKGFEATFDIVIEPKTVSYIRVYKTPTKTVYIEGQEDLDVAGGRLRIYYNNDTYETIYLTLDMVSGFDNYKIGYQNLIVTYAGKTCSFEVYIDPIDYTITFLNWDDSVISSQIYHRGQTVAVPADPTKASDNTYVYTFTGWDKEVVACAGDATYTATYTPAYRDYTVIFKNWNGDVISTNTYHWGDVIAIPVNPTKAADSTYNYTFASWDKTVVNCAGNAIYTATYSAEYIDYTVVFKNWNGEVISSETYHYGDFVQIPANPTKETDSYYIYTFIGWDKDVVVCIGDAEYTATFDAVHYHNCIPKTTEPTCLAMGYTTHTCACGYSYTEGYVDALGHRFTDYKSNGDATCLEDGTETAKCDRCDETDARTAEGSATGHSHTAVETAPTCVDQGYTTHTCHCGDTYVDAYVNALWHSFTNYKSNGNATCLEDGTVTAKCDRCEATDTQTDADSKLGHSFTDYKGNGDATCVEDGTVTAKCNRCEATDTQTDADSKLGHSFTDYKSNGDATCVEDGTETAKCDRCDETDTQTDVDSKLGHSFTDYKSNGDATCLEDGTETAKCDRCEETNTRIEGASAKGHDYQPSVTEPTCLDWGYTTHTCACGDTYADSYIDALGHCFTNYQSNNDATYSADGTKTAKCDRCDATDTVADPGTMLRKDGWHQISGQWYYYQGGKPVTNTWKKDSKGWCYLSADGAMATNSWVPDSKDLVYVAADGYMVYNKWVKDSVGWRYAGADGYLVKNKWQKDSIGWCYLGADGYMVVNNWVPDSKGLVYVGSNGYMVVNQWVADDGGLRYVGSDGYITRSKWIKRNNKWCYLDTNGYMATNCWKKDSKGWCYLDAEGFMVVNQWVPDSVGLVYVGSDGYMVVNKWIKDATGWRYAGPQGYYLKNCWQKDSKGWCYLGADGYMLTNAYVKDSKGTCYLDASGYWNGKYV